MLLMGKKDRRQGAGAMILSKAFGDIGVDSMPVGADEAKQISGNQLVDASTQVMAAFNSQDSERLCKSLCNFLDVYYESKGLSDESEEDDDDMEY